MNKTYDFDQTIERRHSGCVKYDTLPATYGRDDLIPMWVADMDFRSPDFVMDAIRKRCEHEVLGYAIPSENYWQSVTQWLERHYGIHTDKSKLHFIPGIVSGISFALLSLTQPGDSILVTTPVYPPFINVPQKSGRTLVCSPLRIEEGRFAIDFDDFEQKAQGCKLFIMSNPHNPAGTLWGKETLKRIAEICHRNNLIVISDEIHADLTLPPHRHTSYSTVSDLAASHSITFMAPSKTFNIAGLGSSVCYVADDALRQRYFGWLNALEVANGNIFAFTAAEAAFSHGETWLNQMLTYIKGNIDLLDSFCRTRLDNVKVMLPEASFLAWMDFSACGKSHQEISNLLIDKAGVVLNDGTTFAPAEGNAPYSCCFRINLGCPRATLQEALERIQHALTPNRS